MIPLGRSRSSAISRTRSAGSYADPRDDRAALGVVDHRADGARAPGAGAAVRQADEVVERDAGDRAPDQGAAGKAQGRPQEAAGRADEALPGALGQPVRRLSAARLPDAGVLRPVPRAAHVLVASAGRPEAITRGDFAFLGSFIPNITRANGQGRLRRRRADRPVRRQPGRLDAADAEHDGSAAALHVPRAAASSS